MSETIGVGIITCNRPEFFKKCRASINDKWYDHIVVVNDGSGPIFDAHSPVLKTDGGEGVGKAKNKAIKHLLERGCDYIILVEDDMLFKDNIFEQYIKAYKETGIHHFMFDESYTNAFEHVDHSYLLSKKKYCTPYWWWPDISNSLDYVEEQACSENSSAIRPRNDWQSNIQDAWSKFTDKHGVGPTSVPDIEIKTVIKTLKEIKNDQ